MKVMIDICIVPIGVGTSVSTYVAKCQEVFEQAALSHQIHAYGTNVEGEWDDVMAAVKLCHQEIHKMGAPRVTSSLRLGTRTDRAQTMDDKVKSVEKLLKK